MKLAFGAAAGLCMVALVGCGAGDAEKAKLTCVDATAKGRQILTMQERGATGTLVKAAAVKSPDFEKVYFVAVEFALPGVDNPRAVFATNDLGDDGIIFAVDGIAKEFTTWIDGDSIRDPITVTDPSVNAALSCLG